MKCKDVSHLVSRSLDEELPFTKRLGVKFHLLYCRACREFSKQAMFLKRAIQQHKTMQQNNPAEELSLPENIKNQLQSVINKQNQ